MKELIFSVIGLCSLFALIAACYYRQRGSAKGKGVKSKVVGITGTIASGKSLVGKLLEELGVPVLDTDHIAHDLQANDGPVREALRHRFGEGIFTAKGAVDRKVLGSIVFNDRKALADLNAIMHPAVMRDCRSKIEALNGHPLVAVLVPLLFEAGLQDQYDEIWTVVAREEIVKERLKARDHINDEEAEKRIRSQFPQEVKVKGSDHVIDNSGTIEEARKQVLALLGR